MKEEQGVVAEIAERNGGEKWRSCAREEERGCSFEP